MTKTVQGFDPGQSFSFTSDFAVTPLSNGGSQTFPLAPNATYSVTEDGVLNWLLVNASPAGVTGQGATWSARTPARATPSPSALASTSCARSSTSGRWVESRSPRTEARC